MVSSGAKQHGSPPSRSPGTQHSHDGPSSPPGMVVSASPRCRQLGSIHQSAAHLFPLLIGFTAEEGRLFHGGALTCRSLASALPIGHGWVDRCALAWLLASATCSKAKVMSAVPGMDFFFVISAAVGGGGSWSCVPLGLLRFRELLANHPLSSFWEGSRMFWEPAPDHLWGFDIQHQN